MNSSINRILELSFSRIFSHWLPLYLSALSLFTFYSFNIKQAYATNKKMVAFLWQKFAKSRSARKFSFIVAFLVEMSEISLSKLLISGYAGERCLPLYEILLILDPQMKWDCLVQSAMKFDRAYSLVEDWLSAFLLYRSMYAWNS